MSAGKGEVGLRMAPNHSKSTDSANVMRGDALDDRHGAIRGGE